MNPHRTSSRNGETKKCTVRGRSGTTFTSSSKAIPKTFAFNASSPRSTTTAAPRTIRFTSRISRNRNTKPKVPAPPKFLTRSTGLMGQAQVRPMGNTLSIASSKKKITLHKSRTELRQTRQPTEEDTARKTDSSKDSVERAKDKKVEPNIRRHDQLVYRSESCTFNQDYLNLLTFDQVKDLSLSDEEEEKEEDSQVAKRANSFKPYVKKQQSSGFGFWSSGLEESLLSGSGFNYKPSIRNSKKPVQKTSTKVITATNALPAMMRS